LLLLALVETWALARRPWAIDAVVGGADSALLGEGFYTKEIAADATPFRWTTGTAVFWLPWTQPGYRVILRANTATGEPHPLELRGCGQPIATLDVQPGNYLYQVAWVPQCDRSWPGRLGAADLSLDTPARTLKGTDPRELGLSLSALHVRGLGTGPFSAMPLLIVALCVAALALLIRPRSLWLGLLLAGLALGLPLVFDLLAWHPPVGTNYTWLPMAWLPGLVALALIGLALIRVIVPGRYGTIIVLALISLLFLGVLLNLNARWDVKGPDFAWYLNQGGSWERVFRAHPFHPFGFPLVLWLGQLAGDLALPYGRTASLVATLIVFAATVTLAWRMAQREGAWLSALLFLASPFLIAYGVLANSDALLLAPAMLALVVLCWFERPRAWQLLLAGLFLGIAYLFRYQALLLVGGVVLGLLGLRIEAGDVPRRFRWLRRLGYLLPIILLLAGFLAGSAPQWILDIRDAGRPFYSEQQLNIWYYNYNQYTLPPPEERGLWNTLNFDPAMLWRNWMANLHSSLEKTLHALFVWPVGLLALFGAAWAFLGERSWRGRLLVLWSAVYILAVTVTVNKERFFLPILPVLVVLGALVLVRAREPLTALGRGNPILYQVFQVAMWCWIWMHLATAEAELANYGAAIFR
jgi:hypothetical protein